MNNRANHEEPLKTTDDHCDLAVAAHLFRLAVPREYLRVVGESEAHRDMDDGVLSNMANLAWVNRKLMMRRSNELDCYRSQGTEHSERI